MTPWLAYVSMALQKLMSLWRNDAELTNDDFRPKLWRVSASTICLLRRSKLVSMTTVSLCLYDIEASLYLYDVEYRPKEQKWTNMSLWRRDKLIMTKFGQKWTNDANWNSLTVTRLALLSSRLLAGAPHDDGVSSRLSAHLSKLGSQKWRLSRLTAKVGDELTMMTRRVNNDATS
jgi:hypothetical protein